MIRDKVVAALLGIMLIFYLYSCSEDRFVPDDSFKKIYVDNRSVGFDKVDYVNIKSAVDSSTENSRIYVGEGIYIVDNPIIIKQKGIMIIGNGSDKTIVYPKNTGKEIFKFAANNVSVEGLTINAESKVASGKATFAVHFEEGITNCSISQTKILNTGASAIIGGSIDNCTVDRNIIANSGDDAVQLRGNRIAVSNNIIFKYYDEGLDLGGGSNIIVSHNYVCSGRIGIVVDGEDNLVIYDNLVDDNRQEGIALGVRSGGGVVSSNIVRNGGDIAFTLHNPFLVTFNTVEGMNDLGFQISGMEGGIVRQNAVVNAEHGFKVSDSKRNSINNNKYEGNDEQIVVFDERSQDNQIYNNLHLVARKEKDNGDNRQCAGFKTFVESMIKRNNQTRNMLTTTFIDELSLEITPPNINDIEITGETERGKIIANKVARFLMHNNPGFLNVHVQTSNIVKRKISQDMKSEITRELYDVLKGSGNLGIGIVRMPYFWFRWSSNSYFPRWHLTVRGKEVAVVSRKLSGPEVKIDFKEDN